MRAQVDALMQSIKLPPFRSAYITKLLRNYRSHPEIPRLPNELFYDGELLPCADRDLRDCLLHWDGLPNKRWDWDNRHKRPWSTPGNPKCAALLRDTGGSYRCR